MEGWHKSDGHGNEARSSGGGGVRGACSENLCCPLAMDGREICLCLHSKGDCVRSCTRSHSPLWVHSPYNLLRYIGVCRVALNSSKKRKLHRGGDRESYKRHWETNGRNGTRHNLEGQNQGIGAGYSVKKGSHVGGRKNRNHNGGGYARGVTGNNTDPPQPRLTDNAGRRSELLERREVGVERTDWLGGWVIRNICEDMPSSAHSEAMPLRTYTKAMPSIAHSEAMSLSAHDDQSR